MNLQKSSNLSSTLSELFHVIPQGERACACVTYTACNVMLCQHIQRPPQRLPHLDRMTHEQGTNLLILARQFNAIKLFKQICHD